MLVIDASIIGGILLADEWTERVPDVAARVSAADLAVPAHWPAETMNLLTMAMRRGRIDREGRDRLAAVAAALPVQIGDAILAWGAATNMLTDQHRLTVYDAAYLELAQRLGADLATNDRQLIAAACAVGVATVSTRA